MTLVEKIAHAIVRHHGFKPGAASSIALTASKVVDQRAPTQDAYDAACKALAHWRKEAARLGKIAGETPREMKHT